MDEGRFCIPYLSQNIQVSQVSLVYQVGAVSQEIPVSEASQWSGLSQIRLV